MIYGRLADSKVGQEPHTSPRPVLLPIKTCNKPRNSMTNKIVRTTGVLTYLENQVRFVRSLAGN